MAAPDNTVGLMIGGATVTGFTGVTITRQCEGLPNSFELALTANNPGNGSLVVAQAGQPCAITVGGELVLTGFVDEDGENEGPESHDLIATGRGKPCDLVDCSVNTNAGGFVNGVTILALVQMLAADYGLTVSAAVGANTGTVIPSFAIQYGETPASIIDRVCRAAQLLCYEGPDGNLILSQVGSTTATGGISFGANALAWSARNSMAARYSVIKVQQLNLDSLKSIGGAPTLPAAQALDANVPRFRLLYTSGEGLDLQHCKMKAQWEVNRRAGQGTVLRATVDSWRDSGGSLWRPNTLVPISGPGLRVQASSGSPAGAQVAMLCISSVTLRLDDDRGHVADIVAMPPYAFAPAPVQLQPPLRAINANDGSGLEPLQ